VLGGALKTVDPSGSVGALRALGLPVGALAVRVAAVAEVALGALALAVTSALVAALVALSYAAFAAVTVVALRRRLPIDSCGCLGRLETPPSWRHLVVVGVAFAGALAEAVDPSASLLERLGEDGAPGVWFAVGAVALAGVAVMVLRSGRRPIGGSGGPGRPDGPSVAPR
jgi:hypothetical protein